MRIRQVLRSAGGVAVSCFCRRSGALHFFLKICFLEAPHYITGIGSPDSASDCVICAAGLVVGGSQSIIHDVSWDILAFAHMKEVFLPAVVSFNAVISHTTLCRTGLRKRGRAVLA